MSTITFEMNGETKTATIKENIPFNKLLQAIEDGVAICYGDDGSFHPEMVDFAIEYMCLSTLTDVKMGKTADNAWKYIRAIDGVPSVDADFISDGIRARIEHNTRMVTASMQSVGLHDLLDRLDRIAVDVETTVSGAKSLIEALLKDAERNADVDLQAVVDAVKSGNFTEQKVASAVLDYQEAKKQIQAEQRAKIMKAATKKSVSTSKKTHEPMKE